MKANPICLIEHRRSQDCSVLLCWLSISPKLQINYGSFTFAVK